MATLKKWSASGTIPWLDLSSAANALESAIRSGALNLRGPRDPSALARLAEAAPAFRDGRVTAAAVPLGEVSAQQQPPGALSELLLHNRATLSRLQESVLAIAEAVQLLKAGPPREAEAPSQASHDEALIHAINQLDATRKHLLLQWDAHRQTLITDVQRQASGYGLGVSAPSSVGGPDALDWQRIQGRLSRIEQTLERIETRWLGGTEK